jgi:hypothetical protein
MAQRKRQRERAWVLGDRMKMGIGRRGMNTPRERKQL